MKRVVSLILAVVMVVVISTTVFAAKLTPTVDKSRINAGDQVTVTLTLDGSITNVKSIAYNLYYNNELFDFDKNASQSGAAIAGVAFSEPKSDSKGTYTAVSYVQAGSGGATINADVFAIAKFTAKENISTESNGVFEVTLFEASDTSWGDIAGQEVGLPVTVTVSVKSVAVESVTLNKSTLTLTEGETATLTATVSPENATDKTVTWSSDDEEVATVDQTGKVTAVAKGKTKITATAGGVSATCEVTVNCDHSKYEVTYACDADNHWQICSGCYDPIDKNSIAGHTYGEWSHDEESDPSSHIKFCICGSWVEEKCSGEEDDGNCETAINCSKCKHPLIAAGQHSFTKDSGKTAEEATCENNRKNYAKCANCDVVSETKTVEVENTALGHAYGEPTYTWSEDNTTCTAERVCSRGADHKETENATITSKITQAQSCTAPELTKYTATFTNTAFATQTKENVQTNAAADHEFTGTDAKEATCKETGNKAYWTCSVCEKFFSDEKGVTEIEKDSWIIAIDSNKHTSEEYLYTANEDGTTHAKKFACCQAVVVEKEEHIWGNGSCTKCGFGCKHSYTVASDTVVEKATCESNQKNYAKCEKCSVVSDTVTIEIQDTALDHAYGEPTYTWNDDNTTCTAKRVCGNDNTHIETENATITSTVTQAQSCTAPELTTYTATFTNTAFATQTKENVQTNAAAGHNGEATWTTTETTHKQAYSCCGTVVVEESDHVWGDDDICDSCEYEKAHICDNGTLVSGFDANCATETNGQKDYYECSCGNKFYDKACTNPVANDKDLVIAWAHTLTHHDEVAANCRETGMIEYWECSICTKLFSDAEGKTEVEKITTEIDPNNHKSKEVYYTENDADTHKKFHKCCDVLSDTEDHVWGEDDICDICGYEKAHICDNGTLVSGFDANCATETNGQKDYYECSCGNKFYDKACTNLVANDEDLVIAWAHTGGEATCQKLAVCKVCKAEYGEKAPDNHADEFTYTDNENGETHTVAYKCCKVVINGAEPHIYEDGECTCGAELTEDPTPDDTEYVEIELEVGGTATETQNDLSSALTDDDIIVKNDDIVSVTMEVSKNSSGNSWWDNWGGSWGNWWGSNSSGTTTYDHTITFEALAEGTTVVQVGEVFYKVTVIAAHVHEYTGKVTEPTCTEQGYTTYICECGDFYVDNYVDALGHQDEDEDGCCDKCEFSMVGVEIELEVGETATETQNGLSSALTNDDIIVKNEDIVSVTMEVSKNSSGNSWWDNWGGSWGNWWGSNSSGTTTYDHTITFEALAEGTTVVQVGEVFYKVTVIATHVHEHTKEVTEPTCTEQGYTTYTCECGDSYVDDYVDALGHDYENGVCGNCGEKEPEIPETFAPKSFTACLSKSSVTVGKSVTITVKTSTEVDYVEINGEVVDTYKTTTTGWGFNKTKYRTFTYTVSEDAAGTYEYEVYAYNADGAQSETSKTLTLTVKGFGGGSDWGWGDWWWN